MKKMLLFFVYLFVFNSGFTQINSEGIIGKWDVLNTGNISLVGEVDVEVYNGTSLASTAVSFVPGPNQSAFNYMANPTIQPNANGTNYLIRTEVSKNINPLNGVSTLDIVLIVQHIQENLLLEDPFDRIAADVDNNARIEIADLWEIRNLILNNIQNFDIPSWRFLQWAYLINSNLGHKQPNLNLFVHDPFTVQLDGFIGYPDYLEIVRTSSLPPSFTTVPLTNSSFFAIKTGDVNDSFNPLLRRTPTPEWKTTPMTIPAGSEGSIILRAEDFQNIAAYQMGFRFDPTQIQLLDALPGDLSDFDSENFSIDNETGELRTLWFDKEAALNTLEKGEAIYKIRFKALRNIYDTQELLSRDADILATEFYNQSDIIQAELSIDFQLDEKEQLTQAIQATPNPFYSSTLLTFELASAAETTIEILDLSGKVLTISQDQFQEGWNSFELNNSMGLPKGTLIVRITTAKQSISGKIVKLE